MAADQAGRLTPPLVDTVCERIKTMKFEITHRHTGAVLYSAEIDCEPGAPPSFKLRLAALQALKADASLEGADLRGANLRRADLREADLGGADLRGADLRWAILREAILGGANLRGADLCGADIRGAILDGASR